MTKQDLFKGGWYIITNTEHPKWKEVIKVINFVGNTNFNGKINKTKTAFYGKITASGYAYCSNRCENANDVCLTIDALLDLFYNTTNKVPTKTNNSYEIF